MPITSRSSVSSVLLVLGAFALGCGDDDGGGDDSPQPTTDGGNGKGDASGGGGTKNVSATLVPITADNADAPIVIPHVVSLRDEKGDPLSPPVMGTTGTNGKINLVAPSTAKSIYVVGVGPAGGDMSTYDTIVVNHNFDSGDELLRISSAGTLDLAESVGGFTAKQDRAAAVGAIYWTTDGKLRKGVVGCAKLYLDGKTGADVEADLRYIGPNPLPAPLATVSQTTKIRGQFYIGNLSVGTHTIKASIDDGASFIGENTFIVSKTRDDAESPTKAILYQLNIDVVSPTNPTLASCQ